SRYTPCFVSSIMVLTIVWFKNVIAAANIGKHGDNGQVWENNFFLPRKIFADVFVWKESLHIFAA
ncbi:MAG: hypothetical protein IJR24_04775, partial [Alloprevotella sp.]|nr:hypothetical protein [Alloprevotella sp.]